MQGQLSLQVKGHRSSGVQRPVIRPRQSWESKDGEMSMRPTGHIRQRSNGSFEIRYSLGTDHATGKRRIATTTVKGNQRAAEKELRRLLRTLDTGEHVDPTRMTLREWLSCWLAAVR